MRLIYLDYNATTPIAPSVQEAMLPFLAEHFGNPSSTHALGRACQEAMEDARGRVASLLGCDPEEIVFTSGGSESNNLALKGVLMRESPGSQGHLITSTIEHPAIIQPARFLERIGYDVSIVPCDSDGVVQPAEVERAIRPTTRLVSIMHANNETGVVQPIHQIAEICQQRNILLHSDAAQSVGKIRTTVDEMGVDLLSIAGHKVYGPKGIGALYVRRGVALEPVIHGAGHETGLRAGTENVPYIVALGQAVHLAAKSLDESSDRLAGLRDRLFDRLQEAIGPQLTINGAMAPRLPNTLNINFPGIYGGELLSQTPDLCASTGSACHSGGTSISPTLAAMGMTPEQARGAVRLTVGWYTSEEDVDRAVNLLINGWEQLSSH